MAKEKVKPKLSAILCADDADNADFTSGIQSNPSRPPAQSSESAYPRLVKLLVWLTG